MDDVVDPELVLVWMGSTGDVTSYRQGHITSHHWMSKFPSTNLPSHQSTNPLIEMSSSSDVSFHTAEEGSHSRGVPSRRARGVTQPRTRTVYQRGRRSTQGRGSLVPWSFNVQGHSVSVLPVIPRVVIDIVFAGVLGIV